MSHVSMVLQEIPDVKKGHASENLVSSQTEHHRMMTSIAYNHCASGERASITVHEYQCTLSSARKWAHHLIDLGGVVLLNVAQDADVVAAHKVDCHTLAPVAPRAADAVDVQLTVVGQVIIDHQGHLHHIDMHPYWLCTDRSALAHSRTEAGPTKRLDFSTTALGAGCFTESMHAHVACKHVPACVCTDNTV